MSKQSNKTKELPIATADYAHSLRFAARHFLNVYYRPSCRDKTERSTAATTNDNYCWRGSPAGKCRWHCQQSTNPDKMAAANHGEG